MFVKICFCFTNFWRKCFLNWRWNLVLVIRYKILQFISKLWRVVIFYKHISQNVWSLKNRYRKKALLHKISTGGLQTLRAWRLNYFIELTTHLYTMWFFAPETGKLTAFFCLVYVSLVLLFSSLFFMSLVHIKVISTQKQLLVTFTLLRP